MPNIQIKPSPLNAAKFIEFYEKWESEILNFHPDFELESADQSALLTLNTEGMIIGVFIYRVKGDQIEVEVDFVLPAFRDLGVGKTFFLEEMKKFKAKGFLTIFSFGNHEVYINYLLELGFSRKFEKSSYFELTL